VAERRTTTTCRTVTRRSHRAGLTNYTLQECRTNNTLEECDMTDFTNFL